MHALIGRRANRDGEDVLWRPFLGFCFVGIWAVRAFFVQRFGASVPLVHEWEATGIDTLGQCHQGTYTLEALLKPHNGDHPTVATRLWEIFWFSVNGSWDPKLVMFAKAGVFAAAATMFIHAMASMLGPRRFLAGALAAAFFAFPFGWHNLIWGVASQFDFLFLAAAGGWVAMLSGAPVVALAIGFAGLFTNGAGPLVCASYVPFLAWCVWRKKWLRVGEGMLLIGIVIATAGLGVSLGSGEAAPRLGTLGDRAVTFFQLYAWPWSDAVGVVSRAEGLRGLPRALVEFPNGETSWLGVIAKTLSAHPEVRVVANVLLGLALAVPSVVLAWMMARGRVRAESGAGVLCIAWFACLMITATAWARANQMLIAVRFLDHVVLAAIGSVVASVVLVSRYPKLQRVIAVWAVLLAVGYTIGAASTLLQLQRDYPQKAFAVMQRYFEARDRAVLLEGEAYKALFFENGPREVFALLEAEALQPVLPRALVEPNAAPTLLARGAEALGRSGLFLALGASAAAAWCVAKSRRRARARLVAPVVLRM